MHGGGQLWWLQFASLVLQLEKRLPDSKKEIYRSGEAVGEPSDKGCCGTVFASTIFSQPRICPSSKLVRFVSPPTRAAAVSCAASTIFFFFESNLLVLSLVNRAFALLIVGTLSESR